jgi:hypothetical protein
LRLQIKLNDDNLQANRLYTNTGQLPPSTQMADTRSTAEKLADVQGLKKSIVADLSPIAETSFAYAIIEGVLKSPLNVDNSLFRYLAQNAQVLAQQLSKKYKFGIAGDANDVAIIVNFLEDAYNKTNNSFQSIKNYINSNTSSSSISKGNYLSANNTDNVIAELRDIEKRIDYYMRKSIEPGGNNAISPILRPIYELISRVLNFLPTSEQLDRMIRNVNTLGATQQANIFYRVLDILKTLPRPASMQTLVDKIEKGINKNDIQYITQTRNNFIQLWTQILDPTNQAILQQFRRRYIDEANAEIRNEERLNQVNTMRNIYQDRQNRDAMKKAERVYVINPYDDPVQTTDAAIPMPGGGGGRPGAGYGGYGGIPPPGGGAGGVPPVPPVAPPVIIPPVGGVPPPAIVIPPPPRGQAPRAPPPRVVPPPPIVIPPVGGAQPPPVVIPPVVPPAGQPRGQAPPPPVGNPPPPVGNINNIALADRNVNGEYFIPYITDSVRDLTQPQVDYLFGEIPQNPNINMNLCNGLTRGLFADPNCPPNNRRLAVSMALRAQAPNMNYDPQNNRGSMLDPAIQMNQNNPIGLGLHKKKGRGLSSDYRDFGINKINHKKLDDGIITLRRQSNSNIPDMPSKRISRKLQKIIKHISGGGMPDFNDVNNLEDHEKDYLHKLISKSNLNDRLSVPAPSKDQEEKDFHQFEVMKGEIMSGNDSKELVKKFKVLILKLSKQNILPKNEVQEILEDLLTLGY